MGEVGAHRESTAGRGNRINWWQEKMTPNSENHGPPQARDSGSALHIRFAHWIGVQRGRPGLTVASPLGRLLNFRNSSATGLDMTHAIAVQVSRFEEPTSSWDATDVSCPPVIS